MPDETPQGGLGALLAARGLKASAPSATPAASTPPPAAPSLDAQVAALPKVVIRIERKGRSGKTATVVEQVTPALREPVAKALRKGLGVGSSVEDEQIVVQGDQRDRLRTWFEARGVKRISVSG